MPTLRSVDLLRLGETYPETSREKKIDSHEFANFSFEDHVLGYGRISPIVENTRLQFDELRAVGCDRVYFELASRTGSRRAFSEMFAEFSAGDNVLVWNLDRLGRTAPEVGDLVATLRSWITPPWGISSFVHPAAMIAAWKSWKVSPLMHDMAHRFFRFKKKYRWDGWPTRSKP